MDRYLILTAGGTGTRMGSQVPKQMMDLNGEPILFRTLKLFLDLPYEVKVIIVINPVLRMSWKKFCQEKGLDLSYFLVNGGVTRFHSVRNALKYVPDGVLVAVHDAVRPLLKSSEIEELFHQAENYPATVPVTEVVDSMRQLEPDGTSRIVDRDSYRLVQTPQIFRSEILKKAYEQPYSTEFTDDASVVEKNGIPLHFCKGSRLNIKITTPEDMVFASSVLRLF